MTCHVRGTNCICARGPLGDYPQLYIYKEIGTAGSSCVVALTGHVRPAILRVEIKIGSCNDNEDMLCSVNSGEKCSSPVDLALL